MREYIWLGLTPVAVIENGQVYLIRADHIGRPSFATDLSGAVVWSARYDPFGAMVVSSGPVPDLRFPGQWFQAESGLHQNWMRDYDPTMGRYLEPDPLGLVDGARVYGYVGQNPVNRIDPEGLKQSGSSKPSDLPSSPVPDELQCAASSDMCKAAYDAASQVCRSIKGSTTAARRARQRCWEQAAAAYAECLAKSGQGQPWPFTVPPVTPFVGPFSPGVRSPRGGRMFMIPSPGLVPLASSSDAMP